LTDRYDELVAAFNVDIPTYDVEIAELDADMKRLKKYGDGLKQRADSVRDLRASLNALGDTGDFARLCRELAEVERWARETANEEARLAAELEERKIALPRLVKSRDVMATVAEKRAQLESARATAQREVDVYTAQLRKVSVNGYDPDAHMRLRTELAELRRSAVAALA
jgi:hypothetical protein